MMMSRISTDCTVTPHGVQRSSKQALVGLYIRNREKPAVDKLLSIIQAEENISVRRDTISQLSKSDDPRIKPARQNIVPR